MICVGSGTNFHKRVALIRQLSSSLGTPNSNANIAGLGLRRRFHFLLVPKFRDIFWFLKETIKRHEANSRPAPFVVPCMNIYADTTSQQHEPSKPYIYSIPTRSRYLTCIMQPQLTFLGESDSGRIFVCNCPLNLSHIQRWPSELWPSNIKSVHANSTVSFVGNTSSIVLQAFAKLGPHIRALEGNRPAALEQSLWMLQKCSAKNVVPTKVSADVATETAFVHYDKAAWTYRKGSI